MKHQKQLLTVLLMSAASMLQAQRSETLLEKNWKFSKGDFPEVRGEKRCVSKFGRSENI